MLRESREAERAAAEREALVKQHAEEERFRQAEATEQDKAAPAADAEQQLKAEAARRPDEDAYRPDQAIPVLKQDRCQSDDAGTAVRTEEGHRREESIKIDRPLKEEPIDRSPLRRKNGSGAGIALALAFLTIIVFGASAVSNGENSAIPSSPPKGNPHAQAATEGSSGKGGVISNNGTNPDRCLQVLQEIQRVDRDETLARKPLEDRQQVEDSMLEEVFENGDPRNRIVDEQKVHSEMFWKNFSDNRGVMRGIDAELRDKSGKFERSRTQLITKLKSLLTKINSNEEDCGAEDVNTVQAYLQGRALTIQDQNTLSQQRQQRLQALFQVLFLMGIVVK